MRSPEEILSTIDHRPWPLPAMPWVMTQQWSDLLFAHWALPPAVVRPLVPPELELDLYEGKAWVGLTPFRMTHIQLRGLPPIPGADHFMEMNLRTYVRQPRHSSGTMAERHAPGSEPADAETKPGVFFFSLDASNLPAVVGARVGLGLPYFWSDMSAAYSNGAILYASHRKNSDARVAVAYTPGPSIIATSELERFLTERYCLYEVRLGLVTRTQIHHAPWPLQKAEAVFKMNTVGAAHKLPLTSAPDLLHFSKQLDVLVFSPG